MVAEFCRWCFCNCTNLRLCVEVAPTTSGPLLLCKLWQTLPPLTGPRVAHSTNSAVVWGSVWLLGWLLTFCCFFLGHRNVFIFKNSFFYLLKFVLTLLLFLIIRGPPYPSWEVIPKCISTPFGGDNSGWGVILEDVSAWGCWPASFAGHLQWASGRRPWWFNFLLPLWHSR